MSKISISLAGRDDVRGDEKPGLIEKAEAGESTSKAKKGGAKSPRQQFMSALMQRLSGDNGNNVANAFLNDRKKFKGMMMGIVSDMAKVDGDDE